MAIGAAPAAAAAGNRPSRRSDSANNNAAVRISTDAGSRDVNSEGTQRRLPAPSSAISVTRLPSSSSSVISRPNNGQKKNAAPSVPAPSITSSAASATSGSSVINIVGSNGKAIVGDSSNSVNDRPQRRSSSAGVRRPKRRAPAPPFPAAAPTTSSSSSPLRLFVNDDELRVRVGASQSPAATSSTATVEASSDRRHGVSSLDDPAQTDVDDHQDPPRPQGSPQQRAAAVRNRLHQLFAESGGRRSILSTVQSPSTVNPITTAIRRRNSLRNTNGQADPADGNSSQHHRSTLLSAATPPAIPRRLQSMPTVMVATNTRRDASTMTTMLTSPTVGTQTQQRINMWGENQVPSSLVERFQIAEEELNDIQGDSNAQRNGSLQARVEKLNIELDKMKEILRAQEEAKVFETAKAMEASLADEEDKLCSICMERPKTHAFVPCGHMVCLDCSVALYFQQKENLGDQEPPCSFCNERMAMAPIKLHF